MTKTITLFLVAFMAVGAGLAFAEERSVDRETRDGLTGDLYRLSEIEDFDIMGQADDTVGSVEEAVLTLDGQVTHLIAHLRDVEGIESGRYLVPLDSITVYDTENMRLDLQGAEEFQSYEGEQGDEGAYQLPEGSVRSSDFLGFNVVGPQDDQIANMEDLVVDLGTGQVVYVAIASGGFLGIGRDYYAVSFDQLQVMVAEERVRLDVTDDDLDRMAGFDSDNWPAHGQDTAMVGTENLEVAEESEADDFVVAVDREVDDREADDQEVAEDGEAEDRDGLTGNIYRLSEIESFDVVSHADDDIGNVDEAVLTLDGKITHLIVDLRDVEGLENGKYFVPLDSIRVFDNNMSLDLQRAQDFQSYEGDSAAERARLLPEGSVTSSDLFGYDVVGRSDDQIANMEDLVVDLGTGQIVYVAIASGGFLGIGRDYYAVSFDQVQIVVPENQIRLDISEDELDRMVGFDSDNWPAQGQDIGMIEAEDMDVAEEREAAEDREANDRDGLTGNLYRISKIDDFAITGQTDERIGNVVEPVLTLDGEITHLIVHLYDLEYTEDGRYLVPMDAISLYGTETFKLDVERRQDFARFHDSYDPWVGDQELRGVAGDRTMMGGQVPLDTERGTETTETTETIDDRGMAPAAQRLPEGTVRASEFLHYDVVLNSGDDVVANTEDLVVDLVTNRVVYMAIGSGGFLGIGRNYHAIAFDLIDVDVVEQRVRIDVTEQEFEDLESFDLGQWPLEGRGRTATATTMLDSTQQSE